MKAEETRKKLYMELSKQFSRFDPGDPTVNFPSPSFEKPKMFETKKNDLISSSIDSQFVKGISFERKSEVSNTPTEIYSMKELINTNKENMRTLSYDTKVIKAQLALVKKKEWQDILFSDVNLFENINIISEMKKLFHIKI